MPSVRRRFGPQRSLSGGSNNLGSLGSPGIGRGRLGGLRVRPLRFPTNKALRYTGLPVSIIPRMGFVTFNRDIIKTNWRAINRTPLQRGANLIRVIARRSIKRRKHGGRSSIPGSPPYSRYGEGVRGKRRSRRSPVTPPFKMIFNVPTAFGTGQIIGMVGFSSRKGGELPPPGLHELGGRARRYVRNPSVNPNRPRDSQGRFSRRVTPLFVRRSVRYPKRPFMVPAVRKARNRLPHFWRNSIRRGNSFGTAFRPV